VSFLEGLVRFCSFAILPITQTQEIKEPGVVMIEPGGSGKILFRRGIIAIPEVAQPRGVVFLSHGDIGRTDLGGSGDNRTRSLSALRSWRSILWSHQLLGHVLDRFFGVFEFGVRLLDLGIAVFLIGQEFFEALGNTGRLVV